MNLIVDFISSYWQWIIPGGGIVIGLAVAAYIFRSWQLAAAAGAIFTASLAIAKAFNDGSNSAKERQELATKKAIDQVDRVKHEVANMSDDKVKEELLKCSRK